MSPDGPPEGGASTSADGPAPASARPDASAGGGAAPASGWLGGLQTLFLSVLGLVGDGLELLSLELQRAWQVLERLFWLLVAAWAALLTAWVFFWVGLALVLAEAGLSAPLACALVVLANAGVLALCLAQARLLRALLTWESLRRQLTSPAADDEMSEADEGRSTP